MVGVAVREGAGCPTPFLQSIVHTYQDKIQLRGFCFVLFFSKSLNGKDVYFYFSSVAFN